MTVQDVRRWSERFAARTRHEESGALARILALANAGDVISFSGGFPDPATFPGESLVAAFHGIIASGDTSALQYGPTQGLPGCRSLVADRLERLDGRRPGEAELTITSGGIEGLELVAKSMLDPGDRVLVEGPTYLGAIMAFRGFQADVRAVDMDDEGLRLDRLAELLAGRPRPKLLYTIPDHQNPAGVSLSEERRRALTQMADRHGVLVVEDVAYRELGFGDERLPSLWSLAPQSVVQLGTFSKTFFPGVRLGWAAGPSEVVAQLVRAKQNTDQCAAALGQRLLEEYGRRGELDRGILRSRELYRRRWELLDAALAEHMPPGVSWTRPGGGFFTWVTLVGPAVDTSQLAERAMAEGVAFVPGAPFYPDGRGAANLRLSFSRIEDDVIQEGAGRLGRLFRTALGGS